MIVAEIVVAEIGACRAGVQRNDALGRAGQLAGFEGDRICALPAADYLDRIMRYGRCSPSCAVVALIYLQRVKTASVNGPPQRFQRRE